MDTIAVERSIWIKASCERVWQAITRTEHLDKWYATCCNWEIPALEIGQMVKFYHKTDETEILMATIEVLNPPHQFSLRWDGSAEHPDSNLLTSFYVEEEKDGARVTIRETGYETYPLEEQKQWRDATNHGYGMSMENLKAHVEGRELPY